MTNSKQRGSTLVEVLVAATIIALALTAASAMTAMSVKVAENNERHQLALQKAEEALETVRRDRIINSWVNFNAAFTQADRYCLNELPEQLSDLAAKVGDCGSEDFLTAANYHFVRQAYVEVISADALSVRIEITWQDGSKPKLVQVEQRFENY
jgi:prepilin-type N-terminal cleavage/methylation domain-containing protein